MNVIIKFYEEEDLNNTLEIEVCENGRLLFEIVNKSYEVLENFSLEKEEADKFFSEILKIKEMVCNES